MYRLAAIWAALSVLFWAGATWLLPQAAVWPDAVRDVGWHARAMASGYVGAVIVAFLVAPLRRWPADRGALAWSLIVTWLGGRALSLSSAPPGWSMAADLAFFGIAAAVLGRRAWRVPTPNNLLFAGAPLVLMLSVLAPLQVLEMVAFLIAVLAGRVIPGLVNARVPARPARIQPDLERIALGALLAAIGLRAVVPDSAVADLAAAFAALAHALRWWRWAPLAGARADLRLAMSLFAYAWLPIWLLVDAAGAWAPPGAGTHMLAAGLVGAMTWAMMNRSLAEGRGPPDGLERLGALALLVAVPARCVLPFVPLSCYLPLAVLASVAWVLAFSSLAVRGWRRSGVPA